MTLSDHIGGGVSQCLHSLALEWLLGCRDQVEDEA
jgi:hypothetical protein